MKPNIRKSFSLLFFSFPNTFWVPNEALMKSKFDDHTFAFQSETLEKLSLVHHIVVSTGGGAVIRPINWYDNGNNGSKSRVFCLLCWIHSECFGCAN